MRWAALALVAACSGGGGGAIYNGGADEGSATPSEVVEVPSPDYPFVHGAAFTPDGRWLLSETGGVITVWELDARAAALREVGWFGMAGRRGGPPPDVPAEQYATWIPQHPQIDEWLLSRDGRTVIGGGEDALGVWRIDPAAKSIATEVTRVPREQRDLYGLALSDDGRRLLVLEEDRAVTWRVGGELTEADRVALPGRPAAAVWIGDRAVIGGSGYLVLSDGAHLIDQQDLHDDDVRVMAALGDDRIAVAGRAAIAIWRVEGDHLVHERDLPSRGEVYNLAVAPDHRWLAAASTDETATLIPLTGDAPPLVITLPEDQFYGLAIHPHGPYLVTAGAGVRVWRYRRDAIVP